MHNRHGTAVYPLFTLCAAMISAEWLIERYDALLFDLDGTLVDTMALHYKAYAEAFRDFALELTWADYMILAGPPAVEAVPAFIRAAGGDVSHYNPVAIHARKKDVFERNLSERAPALLPSANILFAATGRKPCALVSSGNTRGVTAILSTLGWASLFDAVVTGGDVSRGKPDPEPFLMAAGLLGVPPARCAVLEDTPSGLAAADAAGMFAIDVRSAFTSDR